MNEDEDELSTNPSEDEDDYTSSHINIDEYKMK